MTNDLVPEMSKPGGKNKFAEVHDITEVSNLIEELGLSLRAELELLKEAMAPGQKIGVRLKAQTQLR